MGSRADALWDISDAAMFLAQEEAGERPGAEPSIADRLLEASRAGKRSNDGSLYVDGLRAIVTSSSSAGDLLAAAQPIVATPPDRLFLRDILAAKGAVIPMSTMAVPFARTLSPVSVETAASGVAEGAVSADVSGSITFQPILATSGTLTASLTVSDQLWKDAPAFQVYINQWLPYLLRVREEIAAFTGNGETVNGGVTGVLHDADVNSTPAVGTDLIATILAMCGTLAGQGASPDAVFVNEGDFWTALAAMKGSGYPPTIFDLLPPTYPVLSVPAGTAIAGDFGHGMVLLDREQASVTVYPQHSDYRLYNQSLILGEERATFEIVMPWRFTFATGI
ncbi:MAG TPA: phage major capsid protein [Mycobacteriales bacterium]|nr:phage major capsid protein [Mycobacteriales bacterium]